MLLEATHDHRVLHIALNRPEKRNALNLPLCRDLVAALDQADRDPQTRAILLTGNGKSFCAGMDLSEVLSAGHIDDVHEQLFTAGSRLTKPLVAYVHGAALAGGTGLIANAHVVVASEDATFGLTEIRLGLWPFVIFRAVVLAVGERRAVELSLTGRIIGAVEACQLGLVHHLGPLDRAREIASELAAADPAAVSTGLGFVQETRSQTWEEAGEIARRMREKVFRRPDFQESIRAFLEKRGPKWPSSG